MYQTVQSVFDIAIHLMDAQNESTGSTNIADTKEYSFRTPSLLNSVLDDVFMASDTWFVAENGKRPICPKVQKMEDELFLDESICTGVLPYGLAGLLLEEENPAQANFFWNTFLEKLEKMKRSLPAEFEDIENPYGVCGVIEHGEYSRW